MVSEQVEPVSKSAYFFLKLVFLTNLAWYHRVVSDQFELVGLTKTDRILFANSVWKVKYEKSWKYFLKTDQVFEMLENGSEIS